MSEDAKWRRSFPEAFKREAVAAIRGGRSVSQVAAELGLADRLVRSWLRWAEEHPAEASGPPAPSRAQAAPVGRVGTSPAVPSGLAPANIADALGFGGGSSSGLQDGEHGRGPAEEEHSAAVCGNMLVMTAAGAEDVSAFIVPAAEPGRGSGTFEAGHRSVLAFEAPVILLQPVIDTTITAPST